MADKTQEVRVVVVHGIGSQKVGATVQRWAENLVGFASVAGYRVEVDGARLSADPASVELTVSPPIDDPDDSALPTSRITVVEAHWAEAFPEPTLGRVLRFLLHVAPTLAIVQTILLVRDHRESDQRPAALRERGRQCARSVRAVTSLTPIALGIVLVGVAAPLVATLLLVLLVAASIPVPAVRQVVGRTLGWIAASVGDAYLFVADPISRAAMVERLAECLARPDVAKPVPGDAGTVVLAHSQGAAIAYRALQQMPPDDRPNALITLGSGLGRLNDVSAACRPPWYLTPLYIAVLTAVVAAGAVEGVMRPVLAAAALALLGLAWWRCLRIVKDSSPAVNDPLSLIENVTWLDIWAPFDPVPNGRPVSPDSLGTSYEHHLVAGELSFFRDHVRYDRDWGQTMPLVFARILDPRGQKRLVALGETPPGVRPGGHAASWLAVRVGPFSRRDLVGLALRAVPLVAAVTAVCASDLYSLGLWVRTAVPRPVVAALEALLYPLALATPGLEPLGVWMPAREQTLGAAALVVLGVLGSVVVRRTQSFLQDREVRAWLPSRWSPAARNAEDAESRAAAETRWSPRRWRLGIAGVALTSAMVPLVLMHPPAPLRWTPRQAVQAYLSAMADDDVRRLCATAPYVGDLWDDDGVCSGNGAGPRRLCSAARGALAGLSDDAVRIAPGPGSPRTVRLHWGPDGPPACATTWSRPVLLPTAVSRIGDRWRVSDVGPTQVSADATSVLAAREAG